MGAELAAQGPAVARRRSCSWCRPGAAASRCSRAANSSTVALRRTSAVGWCANVRSPTPRSWRLMRLQMEPVTQEPRRFYDGGVDADARRTRGAARPRLRSEDRARPRPSTRTSVRDASGGSPTATGTSASCWSRVTATFRTDLTSVPALFTWLVPKTGPHLPAALLHDGLIHPPRRRHLRLHRGARGRRVEADRVFRDAMADAGTALIRRWMVWSAVTTATMLSGAGAGWSKGVGAGATGAAAASTVLASSCSASARPSTCSTCT